MSNWTLKEKSQGELQVTIEGEVWLDAQKKAFDKLAKNVEIKGFRKGQAPEKLVRNSINSQQILMEAIDVVANEALRNGIEEHNLWPVARPELKVEHIDETKVDLTFIVTVKPEVTLGQYKDLPFEVEEVSVDDEAVNVELERLQQQYADLEVKAEDATVETGDTAVIDFEGFKDGVAFDGGKGENHPLVIGSNSFIPGFEDQVIGMKVNEEKDIELSFPENYHVADLKGQAVVFKVKVNEIKVKRVPEVDDEFVSELHIKDVTTVEQLKEYLKNQLLTQKQADADNKATNDLITKVVENATVEIPDAMIQSETDDMIKDYGYRLQQQGFSLEQFFNMTGQSEESLRQQMAQDAENKVKLRLVLEAIATAEQLEVKEEDIETQYQAIANQYSMDINQVKNIIPSENLAYDVKLQKALDFIKGK